MATQEDYTRRSELERCALRRLIPQLFKDHKIEWYLTPSEGYDIYDAYVMVFDELTGSINGRFIIECKVRDTHYPQLLLEEKKLSDLNKKAGESGAKVVYINVTPNGSYCFNLTKLINDETEWVMESHWVSTTDKSRGKKSKKVTYIPIEKGRHLFYTTDRCKIDLGAGRAEVVEEINTSKRRFCLYRDVFGLGD